MEKASMFFYLPLCPVFMAYHHPTPFSAENRREVLMSFQITDVDLDY